MKNVVTRIVVGLAAIALSTISMPVLSQDDPPPLAEVWMLMPKSDHLVEFVSGLREHMEIRKEMGDPRSWSVYSAYAGDNFGEYAIRFCCTDWAGLDAYEQWSEQKPELLEHWMTKVHPFIKKTRHHYNNIDWGNSNWGVNASDVNYVQVDEWTIVNGKDSQLDAAIDTMSQIALDQGWADGRDWVWLSIIGGPPKIGVAVPFKNFASMQRSGETFGEFITRKLGSDVAAQELFDKFSTATTDRVSTIWQYHPELSLIHDD